MDVKLQDNLETIDNPKSPRELKEAYELSKNQIDGLLDNEGLDLDTEQQDYLFSAKAELDTLTHSKQYGREFGEPTAVVFLGLLTLAITILTRPAGGQLEGLIFDGFGFIFAGTITF